MPTSGDTPPSSTDGTPDGARRTSAAPSRRAAVAATVLLAGLMLAQVAASTRALVAWDYPYELRGAFALVTPLAGGDPIKVWFRAALALRESVGVARVGTLIVPYDEYTDRVSVFARNVLADRTSLMQYRWRLTDAEFAELVATGPAREIVPGAWVVPGRSGAPYIAYSDGTMSRVVVLPATGEAIPKPSPGPQRLQP